MRKPEIMPVNEFKKLLQGNTPKSNRKIKNATKNEQNGVVFASLLERHMHDLLKMHKIPFEFQKRYVLQEGFKYNGESVRPITYTADFWLPTFDMLIDTKGYRTQQGDLRIKMLKHLFANNGINTRIALPQDNDEIAALVRQLLEKR
nr:MAG TPA: Endonuclease [Caudoviricetes sp.]